MMMSSSKTCSTYPRKPFTFFLQKNQYADNLFSCSGDDDTSAQPTSLPLQSKSAPPKIESPTQQHEQQYQEQQYQPDVVAERATDPRKPQSAPAPAVKEEPDTEFARNGGGMQQYHDTYSRDETSMKDSRPNPNKHEDG